MPVVVCIGEPGHRKEEYLHMTARYARERGLALLAVDMLGSGTGADFEKIAGRSDLDTAIGHVMDYLVTRDDVDEHRIAILGDMGSSFLARGVALDARFAAAVCDGGIWDVHAHGFFGDRLSSLDFGFATGIGSGRIVRKIKCPVLMTFGEHGWLEADHVIDLFDQLAKERRDITLRIFRGAETAASQGHADNPTLANEFIFDWIGDRLGLTSAPAMAAGR